MLLEGRGLHPGGGGLPLQSGGLHPGWFRPLIHTKDTTG